MKRILPLIIALTMLASCNRGPDDQTKIWHYLMIGPDSPDLESAEVGDTGSFSIGDSEAVPYGRIEIRQGDDLREIEMGGWSLPIEYDADQAEPVVITGFTEKDLVYAIVKHLPGLEGSKIMEKGNIEAGEIDITLQAKSNGRT